MTPTENTARRPGGLRRIARLALAGVLCASLSLAGLAVAAGERLTRRAPQAEEALPPVSWAEAAPLELSAPDGVQVPAWTFDVDEAAPTVVLLHPNGSSRSAMLEVARLWATLGCNSVAVTQRAHGDASGERNDFGWSARLDALAALDWAATRRPSPVLLHGVSLGAAAICHAAPSIPSSRWARVRGIVLESPYTTLPAAVRARTAMYLPPILDWVAAEALKLAAPLFARAPEGASPLLGFGSIPAECPVLILSGTDDQHAPPAQAMEFCTAGHPACTLITEEVGHVGWFSDAHHGQGALYLAALGPWFADPRSRPSAAGR